MNSFWLIFWSVSYLLVLFFVANWAEQRSAKGRSLVSNSYVYALSLAVYCTAWTFYGSVGRAAESGVDPARIKAHCEEQLVYYKRPARITMLDALPRSPNGKIARDRLP